MIALYLTLRNAFLVRLAIPCVILCEICFCPVFFAVLLPFYTSTYTAFMRINFIIMRDVALRPPQHTTYYIALTTGRTKFAAT